MFTLDFLDVTCGFLGVCFVCCGEGDDISLSVSIVSVEAFDLVACCGVVTGFGFSGLSS